MLCFGNTKIKTSQALEQHCSYHTYFFLVLYLYQIVIVTFLFLGPWNGKKVLCSWAAVHFHDLKPGWLSPHLCSICYLSRSLHQVHVPPTAVWFSSCPIWHSVEWNRWSSTTATWPVPTCRNCFLAEFQHQQLAEVHQQSPRFQSADHLVRHEDVN